MRRLIAITMVAVVCSGCASLPPIPYGKIASGGVRIAGALLKRVPVAGEAMSAAEQAEAMTRIAEAQERQATVWERVHPAVTNTPWNISVTGPVEFIITTNYVEVPQ